MTPVKGARKLLKPVSGDKTPKSPMPAIGAKLQSLSTNGATSPSVRKMDNVNPTFQKEMLEKYLTGSGATNV